MANKRFQDLPDAGTLTGSEIIPVEQGGVAVYKVLLATIKSFISAALLPLTGGTLTGNLNGTSAGFSGAVSAASFTGSGAGLSAVPATSITGLTKASVGLSNVDNTADTSKPVSTAQASAIAAKLDLAGGTLTGAVSGPSAAFTALTYAGLKPVQVLAQSAVQVTAPTNTSDNVLATIPVPALGANDSIRIIGLKTSFTASTNSKTINIKLNGNVLWTTVITTGTVVNLSPNPLTICNRGATNSQLGTSTVNTSAYPTSVVDTTVPTTLTITGQKASGSESLVLESYTVEILRV